MKKVISLFLLLVALVFSNGFAANAQTVKRIQFAKGKSSATVRGITGSYGIYYNLRVKGGQKMALSLSPAKGVGIKVERGGGAEEVLLREDRGGFYEVYFEEGGEISIFVGSTGARSVPYTLTVKITRMTDI
jgi:hypothetical protein